jgi:thymidine phosphorylase
VDLSSVPGVKVDKHSTGGVGDKTASSRFWRRRRAVVLMMSGRRSGTPVARWTNWSRFRVAHRPHLMSSGPTCRTDCVYRPDQLAPADRKLYALRDVTGTVESIPLISSSIMSKKLAEGVDALILDVKVGSGAFMKKQVDARRLAQTMVSIGRRMDKKVRALITDMNQPLGFAIGNALEIMEASQTLQNAGPDDLTKLSLEWPRT